jgi:hypothetical protein
MLDKSKACPMPVSFQQKWVAIRIAPAQCEAFVLEAAILIKLEINELAEIMDIQLKEISQNRLLLRTSGNNFKVN